MNEQKETKMKERTEESKRKNRKKKCFERDNEGK